MPDTVTIPSVEILRTGKYAGVLGGLQSYTVADLDEMVEAFAAMMESGAATIRVVLKGGEADIPIGRVTVGHNELAPTGAVLREAPVVGRLDNVRRKGDALLADLVDLPAALAESIRKAYPDRSIEGFRLRVGALEVGRRKFKQAITSLALLGEHLPAVTGLADLPSVMAEAEGGYEVDTPVVLAEGEAVIDEKAIERVLASLDAWWANAEPLVARAIGAPIVRTRVRALRLDISRIAGGRIQNEGATDMTNDTDAPAVPVQNAGQMDAAMGIAVISEILGMTGAEIEDVVSRVRSMVGGATPDASAVEPPVAEATQNAAPDVVKLQADVSDLLVEVATLKGEKARTDAVAAVDALIAAGKAVPAQRDTLVALQLASGPAFSAFAATAPTVVVLGEAGTTGGTEEILTPLEIQVHTDNATARGEAPDLDGLRAAKKAKATK